MKLNLEADPNFYDRVHSPEDFDREDRNKQAVEAFRAEVASSVISAEKKLKILREDLGELIESGVEGVLFNQTVKEYSSLIVTFQFLLKQQEVTLSGINQVLEEWTSIGGVAMMPVCIKCKKEVPSTLLGVCRYCLFEKESEAGIR